MKPPNVLITSSGRRVSLLRSIRADLDVLGLSGRIIAADASPLTAAGHEADALYTVPPCTDQSYASTLFRICAREDIRLLIPTIDTELDVLANIREDLQARGTHTLVSGSSTVDVCLDKQASHDFLSGRGLPVPRQWSLQAALESPNVLPYPLMSKPRRGSASAGVSFLPDSYALRNFQPNGDEILQEFVPGTEITVDVWVDQHGRPQAAAPRRRIEVRSGEVSKAITIDDPDVIHISEAVVSALPDPYGPLSVQLIAGEDSLWVLEINPRFGGGFPLAWKAGARYPIWALQDALGLPNDPPIFYCDTRLAMLRFDDAVFVDAKEVGL